jgi:hypothetical protein
VTNILPVLSTPSLATGVAPVVLKSSLFHAADETALDPEVNAPVTDSDAIDPEPEIASELPPIEVPVIGPVLRLVEDNVPKLPEVPVIAPKLPEVMKVLRSAAVT